jgi:hypothetical protein
MFLNWWLGLEALTRIDGGGSIGTTVTNNTSKVLSIEYFSRLLRDLQVTLKHCKIQWPAELADFTQCAALNDLTISQLLLILQMEDKAKILLEKCSQNPTLEHRIDWIGDWLRDPKKALQRFNSHLKNVEWQVQRLYRVRCCIVHGSPIRHRLGLFTANLEFYLKQTILFALKSFHNNDQIKSLDDLYSRVAIATDRTISALKKNNAGLDEVREAVFASAVTRGKAST